MERRAMRRAGRAVADQAELRSIMGRAAFDVQKRWGLQRIMECMRVGEKCPGCGIRCPLADPTCGRGAEAQ